MFFSSHSLFISLLALQFALAAVVPSHPRDVDICISETKTKTPISTEGHTELRPAVHPDLDKYDPRHLNASTSVPLFYAEPGTSFHLTPLIAELTPTFNYPAIVLDYSNYIKSEKCTGTSITIVFTDVNAFAYARKLWSSAAELIFITSAASCHSTYPGQYGIFKSSGRAIDWNKKNVTAVAKGQQISLTDAIDEFHVVWGPYTSTATTGTATTVPQISHSGGSTTTISAGNVETTLVSAYHNTTSSNHTHISGVTSSHSFLDSNGFSRPTASSQSGLSSSASGHAFSLGSYPYSNPYPSIGASSFFPSGGHAASSGTLSSNSYAFSSSSSSSGSLSSTGFFGSSPTGGYAAPSGSSSSRSSSSSSSMFPPIGASGSIPSGGYAASSGYALATGSSQSSDSSSASSSGACGAIPTTIATGLPSLATPIPCGPNFDLALDAFMGFIGDVSDIDSALAEYMPDVPGLTLSTYGSSSTTTAVRRFANLVTRGLFDDFCSWVDTNIIQPAVNVIVAIVDVVVYIVKTVEEIAHDAVELMQEAAAALLPQFHPSISFKIPIDIEPLTFELEDSPWGDAYKIFEYNEDGASINYGINAAALAKLTGADELVPTIDIDGVEEEPEPGVQVYCVDCGITGSLATRGSATYTLLVGFTDLELTFQGNILANFQLGVNAFASYEKEIARLRILEVGVPGFFIPEVITVGPMLTLDVDATVKIDALGQLLAGAEFNFPHIGATINFFNSDKSSAHGFAPSVSTKFSANGAVNVTASVGVPIGVGIGIDVLDGEWTEEVALVDRPALEAVAKWAGASCDDDDEVCQETKESESTCSGIDWYVDVVNELTFDLFGSKYDIGTWNGPTLAAGCLGTEPIQTTSSSTTTSTTAAPTPTSDNLVSNSGFDEVNADGTPTGYEFFSLDQNDSPISGVSFYSTFDGAALSSPNSLLMSSSNENYQTVVFGFQQTIEVAIGTTYEASFNIRKIDGDGVCFFNRMQAGIYNIDENQEDLYNVVAGKNYFENIGGASFSIPSARPTTVRCTGGSIILCRLRPSQCSCTNVPYDDGWTRSADGLTATGAVGVYVECYAGTYADFRVDDFEVTQVYNDKKRGIEGRSTSESATTTTEQPSTVTSADLAVTASDVTAYATSIGTADYVFPALTDMLAAATSTGASASATATAGYTTLYDTTSSFQLSGSVDGNLYLTTYPGTQTGSLSFVADSSIVIKDELDRSFHYYPGTMDAYGVSRIRLAKTADAPVGSRLITLVPVSTGVGSIYTAVDTLGGAFMLAWCNSEGWSGSKIFLIKDKTGPATLMSDDVQWVVTGNEVSLCSPLLLTSTDAPIA